LLRLQSPGYATEGEEREEKLEGKRKKLVEARRRSKRSNM